MSTPWEGHAMEEHSHDEPEDAEREAAIAEMALAENDPAHALHHLANALFDTVGEDTYVDLARRVLAASSIEALFAPDEGHDRRLATKAVMLHLAGRDDEAIDLLGAVATYRVDLPFEGWLAPWIAGAKEPNDGSSLLHYLMTPSRSTVGRTRLRPTEVAHAEAIAEVADALLERGRAGAAVCACASGVYRRAGRTADAIAAAERSLSFGESYMALTMLALAKRVAGDFEGATKAFERAKLVDPDAALTIDSDLGRIAWDAGDHVTARRLFEKVLQARRDDVELQVGLQWLRHVTPEEETPPSAWGRIKSWTTGTTVSTDTNDAAKGASHETRVGRPLVPDDTVLIPMATVGWLPESTDATVNALRQLTAKEASFDGVSIGVSHLEAPSVRLAFAWAAGHDDLEAVKYSAERVPSDPDPREPWDDVPFVLWRFDGTLPTRGVDAPDAAVDEAVTAIASQAYHLPTWWAHAKERGRALGPERARGLAGAMVHRSSHPIPEGMPVWVWLQRRQVAAALLLAHVDASPSGVGWSTLEAILCGPHDWAVEAAILAAVELALDHPHLAPLVRVTLESLLDHAPNEGHVCWMDTFATAYPRLPRTSKHVRDRCDEHWRRRDDEAQQE
ncbi:MAG: tetratricopeptide repeat protein [Sandaracinus sp.]|nr:tetratricopeptide repeat protein [Sandaracinus sp.]